jgi:ribosomal protein L30/L7E
MRPIPVTLIKGLMGKVAPSQQKKTMKLFGKKMGHVAGSLRHRYFYL